LVSHGDRIVGAHLGAHVLQRGDQRNRGLASRNVVGVRLEGQAQHSDGLAAQHANAADTFRAMALDRG
jgi:hypothetical protein